MRGLVIPAGGGGGMLYGLDFVPISAKPSPWSDLLSGKIRLVTATATESTITATFSGATSVQVDEMHLPFSLIDDDDRHDDDNDQTSVLPVDVTIPGGQHLEELVAALAECCIFPDPDGGGNVANNGTNLPFIENATGGTLENLYMSMQSTARTTTSDAGYYWYVYLGFAYQYRHPTAGDNRDWDPNATTGETAVRGVNPPAVLYTTTTPRISMGTNSAWVFMETIADRQANQSSAISDPGIEARVLAHEIGHQLGLAHEDEMGTHQPHGLMVEIVNSAADNRFSPFCQNLLRLRYQEVRHQ